MVMLPPHGRELLRAKMSRPTLGECCNFSVFSKIRLAAAASQQLSHPLFLASTVSALHRNAHIYDASHPLSVTYYY